MKNPETRPDDDVNPTARRLFGWVERPSAGPMIFWGIAALSAALVALDLVIHRHEYFHIAEGIGFYAIWGFGSFAFVVLMGWPLGRLLRRDEDYYGDAGGPPAGLDPALDPEGGGRADGDRV